MSLLLTPPRFHDRSRLLFRDLERDSALRRCGIPGPFVQDNHAASSERGVVRGLHCRSAPNAQGKLVRVVRGSIWDVAVDVRRGSPTYGQHVGGGALPRRTGASSGCPSASCTATARSSRDTEVIYKVTAPYDRSAERGVIWNDPELAVPWPIDRGGAQSCRIRTASCRGWPTARTGWSVSDRN